MKQFKQFGPRNSEDEIIQLSVATHANHYVRILTFTIFSAFHNTSHDVNVKLPLPRHTMSQFSESIPHKV